MERLRPGEFKQMTPEQQAEHMKQLRKNWRHRHPEFVKAQNKKFAELYKRTKPHICICKICGCEFNATRKENVRCPKCWKSILEERKQKQFMKEYAMRAKIYMIESVVALARTGMPQKEMSARLGIKQATISAMCRKAGLRRKPYHTRQYKSKP